MNNTGYGNMLKEYFGAPIKIYEFCSLCTTRTKYITEIALDTLAKH